MLVKIHKTPEGQIIAAVCDKDLIGKKFSEGKIQLDLTTDFYKGEKMNEEDIGDLLRNAYIVNLVGEKSVALGIKENIIEEKHIIRIDNIPHAEAVNAEE